MPADHPDRAWLDTVSAGIETWLACSDGHTPTSQILGGGALALAEAKLSAHHRDRPTLLVPSASYGLWIALQALGVQAGDEVLLPQYDWTAGLAAVLALGAEPVIVPVDEATFTIDPVAAANRATRRTRAVISTHLFGIPADVPVLRALLPHVPVIEDCAQGFGSTLDNLPVGALGDVGVLSFGPGKRYDVGELGALVFRDEQAYERALRLGSHPIRQQLSGLSMPTLTGLSMRPHPLAAVLLCVALDAEQPRSNIEQRRRLGDKLSADGFAPLGIDSRRGVASHMVPSSFPPDGRSPLPERVYRRQDDVHDIESIRAGKQPARRRLTIFTEGGES